jgi:hypothetical protein
MDEDTLMKASAAEKRQNRCGIFFPHAGKNAGRVPGWRWWPVALLLCMAVSAWALELPNLSAPGHPGWEEKEFEGRTVYTPLPEKGLLMAESHGAASGLFHERTIDLTATPWLNWSWKVENVLAGLNEREKSGDDYPARIYVVAKGGIAFWKTRALTYVWSGSEAPGAMWPNAFTSNAYMIAVRGGTERLGELVAEKRNIREDWKRTFGEDIREVDAVAIMTDTDNSGLSARAWYGQPWFSAE